jgi:rSAM/selenodomain-associated transferase 2
VLSIVIPTLNEEENLERSISTARAAAGSSPVEFIVADCHSSDRTVAIARRLGCILVQGCQFRSGALNAGFAATNASTVLFLHADSILPDEFPSLIENALVDSTVVGGAFDFQFDRHRLPHGFARQALKLVTVCNRIRFRWSGNFYGDQGLFVRREVFRRLGGFPPVRLMEDVRFSRRLKHAGRTVILRPAIHTSPRRFLENGVLRQMARDMILLGFESAGLGPQALWNGYNAWNHRDAHGNGRGNGQPSPQLPLPLP